MKQELLNGNQIDFESDDHTATCGTLTNHSGVTEFFIMFNAKIIHSSKTFKAFEKKLKALINQHGLIQTQG